MNERRRTKSLDLIEEVKSLSKTRPKKQSSVTEPLKMARRNFLQDHIDLDETTDYDPRYVKTENIQSTVGSPPKREEKKKKISISEQELLKRMMHVK